jgi:eukaryotic-like serine/threonine-protein kinase
VNVAYNVVLMGLPAGTKVGSYEIIAPLGAGGMGEVYRARDSKLGRFVAIKILPQSFASDVEHRQRFHREAQTLASVNHPNILSIYDTANDGNVFYLVCELLEGTNLRHRLREGPIPLRRCVDIGVQVANGLAAAHEKGIVHRDLKPENIFLLKDGRVKILDFGLAKQSMPSHDGNTLSFADVQTNDGAVLGTVGYMSPEQVRGRQVNARSDIFSLGVVLYEMIAGKRAFAGESAVEVLNAILKEDPADLSLCDRNAPKGLCGLVHRCLEKNPEQRFESARDLAFALEAVESPSSTAAKTIPSSSHGARVFAYAVVFGLFVVTSFFLGRHFHASRASALPVFHRLTFRPGTIFRARFAPDGRSIVYGAKMDGGPARVFVTSSDSPESRSLEAADLSLLAISDSGELAVARGCSHEGSLVDCRGTLARMPLTGGAPRDVMENVQAADWLPKTNDLAVAYKVGGMYRVEFPIGNNVYETSGWISSIRVSPDGTEIAIAEHYTLGSDGGEVRIVDRRRHQVAQSASFVSLEGIAWSAAGRLYFVASPPTEGWANELHFLDLSGNEGIVWHFEGMTRLHDISREGSMLVSREDWRMELNFRGVQETQEKDLSWFDLSELMDLSTDASEVTFLEDGEAVGTGDLYLRRTDGSAPIRLGAGDWASLSRDGRLVVTAPETQEGDLRLSVFPTGVGTRKKVPTAEFIKGYGQPEFLGDDEHIVFLATNGQGWRIYKQNLSGGNPIAITPQVGQFGLPFQLASFDSKFVWARDLQDNLTIYPLDGSEPRPVAGLSADDLPANWGTDSNSVYVYRDGFPIIVSRFELASGRKAVIAEFKPRDPVGLVSARSVRMTPDGKAGAYSYLRALSQLYVVRDFNPKL